LLEFGEDVVCVHGRGRSFQHGKHNRADGGSPVPFRKHGGRAVSLSPSRLVCQERIERPDAGLGTPQRRFEGLFVDHEGTAGLLQLSYGFIDFHS